MFEADTINRVFPVASTYLGKIALIDGIAFIHTQIWNLKTLFQILC